MEFSAFIRSAENAPDQISSKVISFFPCEVIVILFPMNNTTSIANKRDFPIKKIDLFDNLIKRLPSLRKNNKLYSKLTENSDK